MFSGMSSAKLVIALKIDSFDHRQWYMLKYSCINQDNQCVFFKIKKVYFYLGKLFIYNIS